MLDFIIQMDVSAQHFIQEYLAPAAIYPFMDFFAQKENAIYLGLIMIPTLLIRNWKKTLFFLVVLALTIALADQTSYFFKRTVKRVRPNVEEVRPGNEYYGGRGSFPSSHAANIVGAYCVIKAFWPVLRFPTFLIMVFVCYGRLYLNKHHPLDVLMGILIGLFAALLIRRLVRFVQKRFFPSKDIPVITSFN